MKGALNIYRSHSTIENSNKITGRITYACFAMGLGYSMWYGELSHYMMYLL